MAAEYVSADAINFMATHGRGLICLTLTPERCDELGLQMMVQHNQTPYGTAFTVSIEAREGIKTGISAKDRAHTIQVACATATGPRDILSRATSSRCARARAACSSARGRPRPPSTSRGSPACARPA